MTEEEQRKIVRSLVDELLEVPSEKRESEINFELDKLSPDPKWSDYIFWSNEYIDDNDHFLMENFLDKIFSYKSIYL